MPDLDQLRRHETAKRYVVSLCLAILLGAAALPAFDLLSGPREPTDLPAFKPYRAETVASNV